MGGGAYPGRDGRTSCLLAAAGQQQSHEPSQRRNQIAAILRMEMDGVGGVHDIHPHVDGPDPSMGQPTWRPTGRGCEE
uniref:Uncharacterized protein n=1 Tax=Globodera rostochiensis TaxID=31243 RepID=A0A914I5T7_GLORO